MNDSLTHRGPDDAGVYVNGSVGIANRRLSILDIAGSRQPIPNEDKTCWIVLNGEIWNYRPLQQHLRALGHQLRTDGDTEVILHLYEQYGADCVHHLDGMFAFAIFDGRQPGDPRLLIARDRTGKKPLYYADVNGTVMFASEIKAILEDARVSRTVDLDAVRHYMSLLMIPAPLSVFRDVRKLPPGHLMEVDQAGLRMRPFWQYQDHTRTSEVDAADIDAEVKRLLFAAVEKRLISEVPLGAFLSGGLDSSAVVAVMSRLSRKPIQTFSIGFEGPATHNELPRAGMIARYLKTDHHEILVKPNIVELLPDIVHYADEPFAISSAIPTYILSRHARNEVTVVLTGDGGDETFGGYQSYLFERWASVYRHLPAAADSLLVGGLQLLDGRVDGLAGRTRNRATRFIQNARRNVVSRRLGWSSGADGEFKRLLFADRSFSVSTAEFIQQTFAGMNESTPPEQRINILDNLLWLPDEMLAKVDRMTMAASLEARCPLLDWELIEFTARLPMAQKIPGMQVGNLKSLLRNAVRDLLPPSFLAHRKWGFNVPLDYWFRTNARAYLESWITPERLRRRGIFDAESVMHLMRQHQSGATNASNILYALLVFEIWADEMAL